MREPKKIKLMADYSADPVWNDDPDHPEVGCMMDLDEVPVRPETAGGLRRWAEMYESSNLWQEPEFHWTPAEADAFEREGIRLWQLVRAELAPAYEVVYFSEKVGRRFDHPDDLVDLIALLGEGA